MNVATRAEIMLLDIASGTGMLGEAVAGALACIGVECRTACHVEWTAEAAACLVARAGSPDEARAIATAAVDTARAVFGDWAAVARVDPARMPAIESAICGVVDGLASRSDQLRLTGNGVDTMAAAHAFLALWARSMHAEPNTGG